MSSASDKHGRDHSELVSMYALQVLPADELPAVEARIRACVDCRQEMEALRPIVDSFVSWPTDVLRPSASLWNRLAERVAAETGVEPASPPPRWLEPEWQEVAPGIFCKLLATDTERNRVSMLVRLAPGVAYPPHRARHLLDRPAAVALTPGRWRFGMVDAGASSVLPNIPKRCIDLRPGQRKMKVPGDAV